MNATVPKSGPGEGAEVEDPKKQEAAPQEDAELSSEALAQKKAAGVAATKRETAGQTDAVRADVELMRGTQGATPAAGAETKEPETGNKTWWGTLLGGVSMASAKITEIFKTLGKSITDGLSKLFGKKPTETITQTQTVPAEILDTDFELSELLAPDAPLFSFPATWEGQALSSRVSDIRRIRLEHPVTHKKNVPHEGVDIPFAEGTPIVLTKKARVKKSERGNTAGNYVMLELEDGKTASFMHLQKPGPKVGTELLPGQVLGFVGNTGAGTGAHLHFEVNEGKEDPTPYLDAGIQASAQAKRETLEEDGKYVQLA